MLDLRSDTEKQEVFILEMRRRVTQTVLGNSGERSRGRGFPPWGSSVACSSRRA